MTEYPLAEQKLVYRVLHRHLAEYPELMEGSFLDDLQAGLQKAAAKEGVDVADHGQWDAWLGNEVVGCDVRMAGRRTIG